jgi:hypothetical protein
VISVSKEVGGKQHLLNPTWIVFVLNALVMSMKSMHVAVNLQANMRLTFVFYDAFKSLCR